jgi:hypothetical protein
MVGATKSLLENLSQHKTRMIGAGLAVLALIDLCGNQLSKFGNIRRQSFDRISVSSFRNWNIDYLVKYLLCHTTFLELKNRPLLI